ncbi:MAG: PDZ domain-containing protein [Planctomycetes bacterium]|nr:PDZ domain-containing protein [Planctomycetota bacterium]
MTCSPGKRLSRTVLFILLALCTGVVANAGKPGRHLFIFSTPVPAVGSEARLYFCVQDGRNAYYVRITRQAGALRKVRDGHDRELASAPLSENFAKVNVEIQRREREIVVAVNGRFLCRAEDTDFHGPAAAISPDSAKLLRVQPMGDVAFSDDFMRREPSGAWQPLSGHWEICGVQWADRSMNPFALFCRFPDTPAFSDLERGRTRRYVGTGMRIEHQNDRAVVIHVFDGTPAWEAGVRTGDTILLIDGRTAVGTSREDVVERLQGKEGEPVTLSLARVRDGKKTIFTARIVRRRIDLDSIEDVAVIRPAKFSPEALIAAGHTFWSDTTTGASVRSLGQGAFGLATCVRDPKNYLLFRWSADESEDRRGALDLVQVVDGQSKVLATRPGGFAPEQYYRLRLSVQGASVHAYVDGVPVLDATVPDLTWGRAGLYAANSLGVYFDDVEVISTQLQKPSTEPVRYKPLFVTDEYMTDWAGDLNRWTKGDDEQGATTYWHGYPFPGDARLEVQDKFSPEFMLIINADRRSPRRGFRMCVHRISNTYSLFRNAAALAKDEPLPAGFRRVAVESRAGTVRVVVDGKVVRTVQVEPLAGGRVGLRSLFGPKASRASVSSSNVLDYAFDSVPVDWKIVGGRWGIMNRWVCDPRWSWFGGRSRQMASLWHKRTFEGDVTLDVFTALAMPAYWKSPHERPGDLCLTICAEDDSPAHGYSVIVAGEENRWTRLYRRDRVVDETRSPLFLLPRRELSWDTAMRLHRRWYHLRLMKEGAHIRFFMNGQLALDFLDPEPLRKGQVGVWTVNNAILLSRMRIAYAKTNPPELVFNSRWPFSNGGFTNVSEMGLTANAERDGQGFCATNALPGGPFRMSYRPDSVDAAAERLLSLAFKAEPDAKVDLFFEFDGAPHRIRLTGPEADDGRAIVLGSFPGIAADGAWHRSSFRLFDALKDRYPYKRSFVIRKIAFANRSNDGYLLAGYGGNPRGARYAVGDFQFHNGVRTDRRPPVVGKVTMPLVDPARQNSILFHLSDDGSGVDPASIRLTVQGRSLDTTHKAVRFTPLSGILELDLPAAGITLKDGEDIHVELTGLRDYAGNAAEPYKIAWRYTAAKDRFPPTHIRLRAGAADFIGYDFERNLGDCYPVGRSRTMPGRAGGWLRRERSEKPGRGYYLRVQNLCIAHDFGVGFLTRPCDVGRFPLLTFNYKVSRDVPVDCSFDLDDERKVVRFAAETFRQDLRLYGHYETVGAIPNILADGTWRSASVNLFDIVKSHDPTRKEFALTNIHFGDDVTGYLGNYEGAAFCIDNIRMRPLLSRKTLQPTWTAEDVSGVADHRIAVNAAPDSTPVGKTLDADTEKLEDGIAYIHLMLRDGAGNWSAPVHEQIIVDVTPPRVETFEPQRDMAGTFTIRFAEKNGLDPGSVAVSVAGKTYRIDNKVMWYDQQTETLTWRLGAEAQKALGDKAAVEVRLLSARDFAGNGIDAPKAWTWELAPAGNK